MTTTVPIKEEKLSDTSAENQKRIDNHKKAAQHHEQAAKQHHDAARQYETANRENGNKSIVKANGHPSLANNTQRKDLKYRA